MERTQIYLPKSQIKRLKELAYKKKTTVSGLVRDAVDVQYAAPLKTVLRKKEETFLEAADRINRLGPPGPKDLASNVDKYLYGDI